MAKHKGIIIVDDSEPARVHIRGLVEHQKQLKVIAEAGNGRDAMALVKKYHPDLVLLDIDMPVMDGLQALKGICPDYPGTHVLIVSHHTDRAMVKKAQQLGARGYVTKGDLDEELLRAIETVMAGGSFLSRAVRQERTVSTEKTLRSSVQKQPGEGRTRGQQGHTPELQVSTLGRAHGDAASCDTGLAHVLVMDDEQIVTENFIGFLQGHESIQPVGSPKEIVKACKDIVDAYKANVKASDGVKSAMRLIEQLKPHILLLDLGFRCHDRGGWEVVNQLRRDKSKLRIILCTGAIERQEISAAWRRGINGYVPKEYYREELIPAIRTVHQGGTYFSPSLEKPGWRPSEETERLTPPEREVFYLFVRDYSTNRIMCEVGLSSENAVHQCLLYMRKKIGHQDGWKGAAKSAKKSSALFGQLTEMERTVFKLYVTETDDAKEIAETLEIPIEKMDGVIESIHRTLHCPPTHWEDGLKEAFTVLYLEGMERTVFDQYVEKMTDVENTAEKAEKATREIAETLDIPVSEVKALMQQIRETLDCHPNGWKGIAREERDIL